jgi:hypothetical protein
MYQALVCCIVCAATAEAHIGHRSACVTFVVVLSPRMATPYAPVTALHFGALRTLLDCEDALRATASTSAAIEARYVGVLIGAAALQASLVEAHPAADNSGTTHRH